MIRFLSILSVLSLLVSSFGCRMCGTCYDYCVPAQTNRVDDYRGCGPLYRAGSIFSRNGEYNEFGEEIVSEDGQVIRGTNAGNYGITTPINPNRLSPTRLEQRPGGRTTIGRPPQAPRSNGNDSDNTLPGIDDLIKGNIPTAPRPALPTINPPITHQVLNETIPFSAQSGEPTITVEELRRLDPSVSDIKILNVEDSLGTK